MADLVSDIVGAAEQVALALKTNGYRSDFSVDSLWDIEEFFLEQTKGGDARRRGLLASDTGARLFALGGYVGETIRRARGGDWIADDTDEDGEINIVLRLPNGSLCQPVQRVMKRFSHGASESIVLYGKSLDLPLTTKPTASKARRILRFFA